ncbi:MAG TPA: DUF4147 domain-containing protein [Candidatus Vogelbacteria bacterium]|nr:DUF4147 domain-containing protein [Candidatus Vogelbacteria bacterium]
MIKNFDDLAINQERKAVLESFSYTLDFLNTSHLISVNLSYNKETRRIIVGDEEFSLTPTGKILVVAVGKCSYQAVQELNNIFGPDIRDGVVIDLADKEKDFLAPLRYYKGDHPYPTDNNVLATKELIKLLKSTQPEDIVIGIISGGGSTLLAQPTGDFSVSDEKGWLESLFKQGADIVEINTVRKHLSTARGGWWPTYTNEARLINLIFSDVVGDDLSFISSGPTVLDKTTVADALKIIHKYNLNGLKDEYLIETPKDEKYFKQTKNILVANNKLATLAMAEKLKIMGFEPIIKTNTLTGEAQEVGRQIAQELKKIPNGSALIYGGETTVNITGQGQGGRNQELALASLEYIEEGELIMAVATDGFDNTPSAGAIADVITKTKARENNLSIKDYLLNNDSYTFFNRIGQTINTGLTGINVADLVVATKAKADML